MGAAQVPAHATLRIGATLPVDRSRTRSPCSTLIVLKTSAPLHLLQHMLAVTLQRWPSVCHQPQTEVSVKKTEVLVFQERRPALFGLPIFHYNRKALKKVHEFKYLGLTLDT